MANKPLNKVEVLVLYLVTGLITFGIVLSRTDRFWFDFTYTVEDGFIEWMTVLSLLLTVAVALRRFGRLYAHRSRLFLLTLLGIAAFCFFAAGEELSWGQRLLHLRSSIFFEQNNSQRETNLHNLIIAGQRINVLVFSRLLTLVGALYLLGLPILYQRSAPIRTLLDRFGVPVARGYQVLAFLTVFGLVTLCPSGKRAELLEMGSCLLFFLIVRYPLNKRIYALNSY